MPLINVPRGTPKRFATVIPDIIIATASDSFPSWAIFDATIEATPKYAPWGSPDIKRANNITV